MIRKLRWRFVLISFFSIFLVLFVIVGSLNLINYTQAINRTSNILKVIDDNNGVLPDYIEDERLGSNNKDAIAQHRYFTVRFEEKTTTLNRQNIIEISESEAIKLAEKVRIMENNEGYLKYNNRYYSYLKTTTDNKKELIIFLDSSILMETTIRIIILSIQLSSYALFALFFMLYIVSNKAIEPFINNYENQKRFITNASHELKTPLAVISGNLEVMEIMDGESEWTASSKEEIGKMTLLINQLVSLSKYQETKKMEMEEIDLSLLVTEISNKFKNIIKLEQKTLIQEIDKNIKIKSIIGPLTEVLNILMDNACKYSSYKGTIKVKLYKTKLKAPKIEISNSYIKRSKEEDINKYFERFYRADESHNSMVEGTGIGLSMAENIISSLDGDIKVSYDNKNEIIKFTITL